MSTTAPIWRWEMTQAYSPEKAKELGGQGWEPYAVLSVGDGSAVYFLKRAVKL